MDLQKIMYKIPVWQVVLYAALECRMRYLGLLKDLPSNSLETYPTQTIKDALKGNSGNSKTETEKSLQIFKKFSPKDWNMTAIERDVRNIGRALKECQKYFNSDEFNVKGTGSDTKCVILPIPDNSSSQKTFGFYIDRIRLGFGTTNESILSNTVYKTKALGLLVKEWLDDLQDDGYGQVCPYDLGIRLSFRDVTFLYMYGAANGLYFYFSEDDQPELICELTDPDIQKKFTTWEKDEESTGAYSSLMLVQPTTQK